MQVNNGLAVKPYHAVSGQDLAVGYKPPPRDPRGNSLRWCPLSEYIQ